MRVLHLTRDFPPACNGGISTAVAWLVAAMEPAGFACPLVSFDGWRPSATGDGPPARPHTEGSRAVLRLTRPAQLAAIEEFARAARPDLLHVHDALLWEPAARLRRGLGVPAVLSMHVYHAQQQRLLGLVQPTKGLVAERLALEQADALIAPSQAVVDLLLAAQPELRGRLLHVPPGLPENAAAGAAGPTRSGRTDGSVLYAGRFADIKGTSDLLSAIEGVLARSPGARFVLAGGLPQTPAAHGRWRRRFERDRDPRVSARVAWTGWLSAAELDDRYRQASILCVPSRFETFGLSALEGMLHGLPVVAAGCAALAELIEPGRTGLLFEPGDSAGLAACLVEMLADSERARRLGLAAAEQVRRRFPWPAALAALEAAYRVAQTRRSAK